MQRTPWFILILAFINGLIFVFLVPPWQHYDEPNHFEFAWLIAHRPGWPQEGDFDRDMRAATLQSMIEHNFFRGMDYFPDVEAEEPWIGPVPQIGDAPLYYWLASIPLRVIPPLSVTTQLYAARIVSLLLFLCTVYLAWATTKLLVSEKSPLLWMVPIFVATLPAFVDIMTAVNNDVGAIAAFSLFIFAAVALLVKGWEWPTVILLFLAATLCIFAKRTVFVAIALFPVVLLFAIFRGKHQRWAWLLFFIGIALAFVASFRYGDAAGWYRRTPQEPLTRVIAPETPHGEAAFHLHFENADSSYQLIQFLPTDQVPNLAGKTVTLGIWMWSSEPINMRAPRINLIGKGMPPISQGEPQVALERTPHFFTWTFIIHEDPGKRAWVQVGPSVEQPSQAVEVFLDGAVLAVGDFSTAGDPVLDDTHVQNVVWNGQEVENLLRSPSTERGWVNPRVWADELWTKVFGYSGQRWASLVFYTLRDWPGAGWYYKVTGASLFRTFWATFGWGHVDLSGGKPYRLLLVITVFLVLGGGIGFWQSRRKRYWDVLFFFFLAAGAIWGLTLVRGAHHVLSSFISIPVARYAFPVLYPIALLFAFGAHTWQKTIAKVIHPLQKFPGILWGGFLTVLSIWAWVSIYNFYY